MFKKIKSFLLKNQTARQTVAKNTFWLSISNFGGRLIRAGVVIYAARVLGAHSWGVFNYAITIIGFLTLLSDVGINSILTRETARDKGDSYRSEILSTSFVIKFILIIAGVLVILLIVPFVTRSQEVGTILPIVAFVFIFDALREFGFSLTRALEKMEWEAGLFLLTNVAILAAGVVFLKASPTAVSFSYSYAVGTGIGAVATLWALRRNFTNLFSSFSFARIKYIFTSSWPFAISGLLAFLMINTDILLIGIFKSAEEVGFYSAANRIIQLVYILPTIMSVSLLPSFSRMAIRLPENFRLVVEKVLRFMLAIAIPAAIGGFLVAGPLMRLIFGSAYLPASGSFAVLSLTLLTDFPALILANVLFAHDRQKNLVVYSALGGVSNVILDLILIPPFGIIGSAWATFIAQIVSNIYLWRTARRSMEFQVAPQLKIILLSSALMAAAVAGGLGMGAPVAVVIPLCAALYAGLLYVFKDPLITELKEIFFLRDSKAAPQLLPGGE